MGNIMKFGLERLEQRRFEVRMDCPNCGSARIHFYAGNGRGHPEDISCPKCGIRVILDGLSVTVVNENGNCPDNPVEHRDQGKGSIL